MHYPNRLFGKKTEEYLDIVQKSTQRKPLVLFSSNSYSLNYYFIAQLYYLSRLYAMQPVNIAIIINDMTIKEKYSNLETHQKSRAKSSDIIKVMTYFGVPQENVKIHKLSEAWHNYLAIHEQTHFEFLHNLIFLEKNLSTIPEEQIKLDFLDDKESYEIHYILQKYIDFLISAHYNSIFPSDFSGEVDLQVTSQFSYPLLEKIRRDLFKRQSMYFHFPPIHPLPKLPFFGKSKHIYPDHIVPNIFMSTAEILRAITIYKLNHEDIDLIYDNLLCCTLPKPQKVNLQTPIQKRRILLAEDLHLFLSKIRETISATPNNQLSISKGKGEYSELIRLLNSKAAIEVLTLCNGQNQVSDIARKLKKHQPNVSKIVSKLRKFEIIETDKKKRLVKITNRIQIDI